MTYILSPEGEHLIKNDEGCRLKAYICPAGKLTIGWGHRIKDTDPKQISQKQADAFFSLDTRAVLDELWRATTTLRQCEVDALASFIFNIGLGAWRGSTARRDLLADNLALVPHELQRWIHDDNGKIIEGLVRRRFQESSMFRRKSAA